jgi:hypothetical protein
MGCVQGSPTSDDQPLAAGSKEGVSSAQEAANKQRRRLSVAPGHVGSIDSGNVGAEMVATAAEMAAEIAREEAGNGNKVLGVKVIHAQTWL